MRLLMGFFILSVSLSTFAAISLGKGASGEATHTIAQLSEQRDDMAGQFVRVRGEVKEVCPMAGCWMELQDLETGARLKVKVKDGEIVIPSDSVGKTALVEGKLVARHLSKRQAQRHMKHLADEKGESFDPKTVTGPMTIYEIKSKGLMIESPKS